jgi:cyclopropane-fatty-acyl-phospholipid synthase
MWTRSSDESSEIRPREAIGDRLLKAVVPAFVKRGTLRMITASGRELVVGDGTSPKVAIRFKNYAAQFALVADPDLRLGELFMDERLVVEEGSIYDFLQLALQDTGGERPTLPIRSVVALRKLARRFAPSNNPIRAKRNVAQHYDLDERLYRLFLDADQQYSCAYFEEPGQSLEEAQLAKKRHIAAKLLLEPSHEVLDIGAGWGGLALYLADIAGIERVTGISLSEEQVARARLRAAERGLARRVRFQLEDYRNTRGPFDRIVSVGMFEHVGLSAYTAFFETCRDLLADDGVMLLHTIGRSGPPHPTNPWIKRYIFPGGYLPALSEIATAVQRTGLILTDVEVLRLHYAETLREWRARFLARRKEAARLFDERFCRMWEFYIAASEATFRFEDTVVFQLQLAKRNDIVPLTRGYIDEAEARLREAEQRAMRAAVPKLAAE